MDYSRAGSSIHEILQARILEWVAIPISRVSSQARGRTQVSHIAGEFFTDWATRKPKNTGAGSLSLLQGIFLTQESNRGLLADEENCRQILSLSFFFFFANSLSAELPGKHYLCPYVLMIYF